MAYSPFPTDHSTAYTPGMLDHDVAMMLDQLLGDFAARGVSETDTLKSVRRVLAQRRAATR